jgi:glycosyltransferase involved in cell wall biosynthesis
MGYFPITKRVARGIYPSATNKMNHMKTILYLITQSEFGGAQKYVLDLALGLKDEFNICVGLGEQGEKGEFAQKLKENNIEYYIIKHLKREISPTNDILAIFEIIKLIKKLRPDIIHLNSSKISILGSLTAKLCYVLRVPCYVIYTVHGWIFNEPLASWKKSFYFWAEKLTAILKNKIVCISKLDYDIAKNKLKIKEKKLALIYHGIKPINFLSCEAARNKLKSKIKNLKSEILIGSIANLYKTKGLEYLIEAVRILISQYPNIPISLIIIGEGEERKNLEDLIGQLNLKNRVFLAGNIKNAAELLPAFDVYVNSSVKEGFPYSILEAMSAGLPIVATRVGGIPEMISDGENGLLVEPANPEELAKRMKILIEDKNLRSVLGEQAKRTINERFIMEKMIEKIKEVYLS